MQPRHNRDDIAKEAIGETGAIVPVKTHVGMRNGCNSIWYIRTRSELFKTKYQQA